MTNVVNDRRRKKIRRTIAVVPMFIYATEALILEFLLHKKDAGLWCIDTVLAEISAMTKIAIGSVN